MSTWYKTGTVNVVNGATSITGVGTSFTTFVYPGEGFVGPDGIHYEIAQVVSADQLKLARRYEGPSASKQPYSIAPIQGYVRMLAQKAADLLDAHQTIPAEAREAADEAIAAAASIGNALAETEQARDEGRAFRDEAETHAGNAAASASAAAVSATEAAGKVDEAAAKVLEAAERVEEAEAKAQEAATSANTASDAEARARKWAEEVEDVEVESGLYSARHHALKSAAAAAAAASAASEAADSVTAAATQAAEAERWASEAAAIVTGDLIDDNVASVGKTWSSSKIATEIANATPTLTKDDVGLGSVDNTSDLAKPVSDATRLALEDKVDKVAGKGLSSEDYTVADKDKLAAIEAGAQVNTVISVAGRTGAVTLTNADIGLGSVIDVDQTDASNLASGTVAVERLGDGGTPSAATFLRGDNTWATPVDTTYSSGAGLVLSGTTFSVDGSVVRTSDQQWIGGVKVFNDQVVVGPYENDGSERLHVNGAIRATGNVIAYSDSRLKTDIEIIDGALTKVAALRGVTFRRIDADMPRQTGLLAQEVREVLPEAVVEDKDGLLSIAYGNLVGLLVEAIKELKTKVAALENR